MEQVSMLKRFLERAIATEERKLGASLDYLREIAAVSTSGFIKVALLTLFTRHRKRLPRTAHHLAKVAVTRVADCGSSVQMAVNLALADGVPTNYIRAALAQEGARVEDLPAALREVCEYARTVAEGWDNPELREMLRNRYGTEGVTELAFAIAGAQVDPTLKRAMGHGQRCSVVPIGV